MVFSSLTFIYFFLAGTLAVYAAVPARGKNAVLLIASLLFYAFGEQEFVLLLIGDMFLAFGTGLLLERLRGKRSAGIVLAAFVCVSVSVLVLFKQSDRLFGIAMPLGISFFTFQTVSYAVDVYRNDIAAEHSPLRFGTYVSFFPQLVAGPIVRYSEVSDALVNRKFSLEQIGQGAFRFVCGLGKKVLLADQLYRFYSIYQAAAAPSTVFAWAANAAFLLYVYFDFSGYSDMAIGMGTMFGFRFPENFLHPLCSRSVREFWRRWHVTLGRWFRDYVYIPMGGSRVRVSRWLLNLLTVWLLTGLWHGVSWNFLLWGLYFGLLIAAEGLISRFFHKKTGSGRADADSAGPETKPAGAETSSAQTPIRFSFKWFAHLYLPIAAVLGFVFFQYTEVGAALSEFGRLFGEWPFWSVSTGYYLRSYGVLLAVSILGCLPIGQILEQKCSGTQHSQRILAVLKPVFMLAVLILATAALADRTFSPFLYFRF